MLDSDEKDGTLKYFHTGDSLRKALDRRCMLMVDGKREGLLSHAHLFSLIPTEAECCFFAVFGASLIIIQTQN